MLVVHREVFDSKHGLFAHDGYGCRLVAGNGARPVASPQRCASGTKIQYNRAKTVLSLVAARPRRELDESR